MNTALFILFAVLILTAVYFGIKFYKTSVDNSRKLANLESQVKILEESTLKWSVNYKNEISVSAGKHQDIVNYKLDKK